METVDPKRAVHQINQRLSLRKPQAEALRRLDMIVTDIDPNKATDIDLARNAVRSAFGDLADADFEEFERGFPSVCFALATGVGKTRLMGAFISYLYMIGKSRNFFVLAPNLTIYEKLLADFQPASPKYVFRGIEAFAHNAPLIVNAENYEEGRGVRGTDLFGQEPSVHLWMKPGPNQFKIFDDNGAPYQPDFVVETGTEKLIIEVKRSSEMHAAEVLRKADAASLWCHVATKASASDGEKPWSYLLVPETDVQENFTVSGLMAKHTRTPDADLLSRYLFEEHQAHAEAPCASTE